MKHDKENSEKAIAEDTKFLQDLEANCKTKKAEWAERTATRAEELLAIHETIKILNDDDALELFKKTLPSPSLLQVDRTVQQLKKEALKVIKNAGKHRGGKAHSADLDLIA